MRRPSGTLVRSLTPFLEKKLCHLIRDHDWAFGLHRRVRAMPGFAKHPPSHVGRTATSGGSSDRSVVNVSTTWPSENSQS